MTSHLNPEIPQPAPNIVHSTNFLDRVMDSPRTTLVALLLAFASIVSVAFIGARQSSTAQQVAGEARARSELAESFNQKQQSIFCDIFISVANPSVQPQSAIGIENVLKFRAGADKLECPGQLYIISTETLQTKLNTLRGPTQ